MSENIIKVEQLGKRYKLGLTRHDLLGEKVVAGVKGIGRTAKSLFQRTANSSFEPKINQALPGSGCSDFIWALKDVSFEVKRGEVVGIIGRNGAGKSTLLKILTGITEPTKGRAWLKGRVGSLLEVGTGFHPELTGRENIFLNGAILGMTRAEIKKKFDEIVAFSEVEKFIDTPVKRYSSGMYVRLAFAVAAHLEPEILLVDEVLAVGDTAFQKKCLAKIGAISREGITMMFVSHNMASVQHLCNKCLYLHNGTAAGFGDTSKMISQYLQAGNNEQVLLRGRKDRKGNGKFRFVDMELLDAANKKTPVIQCGQDTVIKLYYESDQYQLNGLAVSMGLDDQYGQRIAHFNNETIGVTFSQLPSKGFIAIHIPHMPVKAGRYSCTLYSTLGGDVCDWIQNAGSINIEAGDFFNTGKLPPEGQGSIYIPHTIKAGK